MTRADVTRTVITGAAAAALTRGAWSLLSAAPPGGHRRWTRTNHRGETVSLLEGPALAVGTGLAVLAAPGVPPRLRAAAAVAAAGAATFGVVDDLAESGSSKGLRGHLAALREGRLTTGGLKVLGIGATGLVAAALLATRPTRSAGPRALDLVVDGALVAGTANLLNLLDLRPGRALKASLLATPALAAAHPAGAVAAAALGSSAALLPQDLAERSMLGDCGANALGAVLGTALAAGAGRPARVTALAGVVGLTLASERVSFTKVIEATPVLRALDALGRRPR